MACIRRAVAEDRSAGLLPKRLSDPFGDHYPPQREITAGHTLREEDHVRLYAPALDPEPCAKATEGSDNCIDDQQRTGWAAEGGDAFEISGGGRVHTARPDHRLHEYGRDSLRPDAGERLLHLLQRVVAHLDRVVERPQAPLV